MTLGGDPAALLIETLRLADTLRDTYALGSWNDGWTRASCSGAVRASEIDLVRLGEESSDS